MRSASGSSVESGHADRASGGVAGTVADLFKGTNPEAGIGAIKRQVDIEKTRARYRHEFPGPSVAQTKGFWAYGERLVLMITPPGVVIEIKPLQFLMQSSL
jgi:hypothetical protein